MDEIAPAKSTNADAPEFAPECGVVFAPRPRRGWERAFSLVEVLIVVSVLGILAAIAVPQFLAARRLAVERGVVATLRTVVAEQQLFFLNPVPLPPSAMGDPSRRYARLHELNAFMQNGLGQVSSTTYVDAPGVRYSMVPLWPSTPSLRGSFTIQASEQGVPGGFLYEIDQSGRVVKIR